MTQLVQARRPVLLWALGGALAAALALLGAQLARAPEAPRLPLFDYAAFWAAGRLNLAGEDPYDPAKLGALQQQAEPGKDGVLVMWPAPWALTLVMPLGALDSHLSHALWLLAQFAVLTLAAGWGWTVCGGAPERRWVAWLLAFTFLPSYFVLVAGQLSALILLGLVGFLDALRRGKEFRAGAFLVLVALKPQLTYLFWVALLLWAIRGRRWRLVLGGALGGVAAMAWPLLANPELPLHYWQSLTGRTATHGHVSPLLGTALWLACGRAHFGLQFVPALPGLLWLAWYWRRHREGWDWAQRLPALLFASFLTAAYGAWPFDLVVLLLPLIQLAVRLEGAPRPRLALAVGAHLGVGLLALALVLGEVPYFFFLWMTPALLASWMLLRRPAASTA